MAGCGELQCITREIIIFMRNWKKTGEGLAGHHGMPEPSVGTIDGIKHPQMLEEGERAYCGEAELQTKNWMVGQIKESRKRKRKVIFEMVGAVAAADGEIADTLPGMGENLEER